MQTLTTRLSNSFRLLASKAHALCVDAFHVYNSVIQSGWYEAIEQPIVKKVEPQCPVKRLIKTENISLNFKDTIA